MGDLPVTVAHPEPAGDQAAQAARNDALFRDANERIESRAESILGGEDATPLPFLCECADVACTAIVQMTVAEYEAVRRDSARFATVPGHEGEEPWARVVHVTERFAVVEKLELAGEVATELDPRSGG